MPDFERMTDELRVYVAKTTEDKAYARGFNKGKYAARKEFLYIFICCIVLYAVLVFMV